VDAAAGTSKLATSLKLAIISQSTCHLRHGEDCSEANMLTPKMNPIQAAQQENLVEEMLLNTAADHSVEEEGIRPPVAVERAERTHNN